MSGPTNYDSQGLEMFTEQRPAIVQLADLMDYINEMRDIFNETQQALQEAQSLKVFINPKDYGAYGDGLHDDTDSLQKTFDYAFDNGYSVKIPKGNYLISKPLIVYGYTEGYNKKTTNIVGSGKGVTNIIKTTNTTYTIPDNSQAPYNQHSQNIDSVVVVSTEYARNNVAIDDPWSTKSIARNVNISSLSLTSSAPSIVNSGIYSLGMFFSTFYDIEFLNVKKSMVTTRFNCYSNYINLSVKSKNTGFEFLTPIGGNTTMFFQNVHLDGVDVYGYHIKGNCTFVNCPTDGGLSTVFRLIESNAIILTPHFESPTLTGLIEATDRSRVFVIGGELEISRVANSISFKASNESLIKISDAKHFIANRGTDFPPKSLGKMIEADKSSRIIINDTFVSDDAFTIKSYYSTSVTDKYVVVDENKKTTPFNKYIYYVEGNVLPDNYATVSIDTANGFKVTMSSGYGSYGIVFNQPIDFSNYSRLYMRSDLNFDGDASNGSNLFKFSLNVQPVLKDNGFVSQGDNFPSLREDNYFYDATNKKYYIDISDLFGLYYVELRVNGLTEANVKEIALLK